MSDPNPVPDQAPERQRWPLWMRLSLAALILAFVWSPFLAMLGRMSQVGPALQPTASPPVLAPGSQPPPKRSAP
jgi:hypothetical protein